MKKIALGKKLKSKKFIGIVALVVAGAIGANYYLSTKPGVAVEVVYTEVPATIGSITQSITGTATLSPADSYTVTTLVEGDILSDTFEEGDEVIKDQVLYNIDSSDTESNIEKAQISYDSTVRKYQTYLESIADLNVKTDIAGTVYDVAVSVGDEINTGTTVATIKDMSSLEVEVMFLADEAKTLSIGDSAALMIDGTFETIYGTVSEISYLDEVYSGNRIVREVTIKIPNSSGTLSEGYTASATIGTYTSLTNGTFAAANEKDVTAETSGTVKNVYIVKGSTVSANQTVVVLENDDLYDDLQDMEDSVRTAELSYESTLDSLDDYTITSPISGTVIDKAYKEGETVESGNTLCTIYDLSYLTLTLNIDELDFSNVQVGYEVLINSDSVEGVTYTGVITKISQVGSTYGGVTSYPVTVELYEFDGLLSGMNVDTEIMIESATDVVLVPINAINRNGTVLITADSPSAVNAIEMEDVPEGYVYVMVETGISDTSFIEIISGITEQDTVAYMNIITSSDFSDEMSMGMEMPGMSTGSGMPSGGMPSGGMSSSVPGMR